MTSEKRAQSKDNNLFEDCVAVWGSSISAPITTNLRILGRKGLLSDENDAQCVLTLPLNMEKMIEIFQKNQKTMLEHFADDNGIPFHIEAVKYYNENFGKAEDVSMVVFDDEKCEEELVYGILINPQEKRTTLTFRGSVSKRDYEADADFKMRKMKDYKGKKIRIHKGFCDYLFGKEVVDENGRKSLCKDSKFDDILQNLLKVFEKNPDHELVITGHSLGGSLSLLAGSALAANKTFREKLKGKPIKVFGFGALLVGDLKFLRSYQSLEQEGWIRSVVLMNEGDIIPLLPFFSGWNFYRAVGPRLLIFQNGKRQRPKKPFMYSPPEAWVPCDCVSLPGFLFPRFMYVLCCKRHFWENHTVEATMTNIGHSKEFLEKMTIEGLYDRRGIHAKVI